MKDDADHIFHAQKHGGAYFITTENRLLKGRADYSLLQSVHITAEPVPRTGPASQEAAIILLFGSLPIFSGLDR